jgi:hypothetical protein
MLVTSYTVCETAAILCLLKSAGEFFSLRAESRRTKDHVLAIYTPTGKTDCGRIEQNVEILPFLVRRGVNS